MAQGEYSKDDLFTTDTTDIQELDDLFQINKAEPDEIIPASEEDKKQAKETGKAKTAQEQQKPDPKKEEKEEVVYSELDDDEEDTTKKPTQKEEVTSEMETASDLGEFEEISKGLFKAGIWTRDDDEDEEYFPGSEEEFIERHHYEGQKVANNYISQVANRHGDDAADLFDAVYRSGVPVKEFVAKWQESQDFKAMDLTDESNQERVVRTAYEQQGIPADKISDKIKKLKLAEDLEDEANTWHEALVKKQDANLQRVQQESQQRLEQKKQADIQYSTAIRSTLVDKLKTQEFDGIPVNSKTADKTRDFLETKKWKLNDGTLITDYDRMVMELKNPQNIGALVKLGLLINYEPGKPIGFNLDAVAKRKETKQVQDKFFDIKKNGKKVNSSVPDTNKEKIDLFADL